NSVYPLFTEVGLKSLVYENASIQLFPNPAKQNVRVQFEVQNGSTKIELMNLQGVVLFSKELNGLTKGKHEMQLNLDQLNLSTGIYFIQLNNGNTFVSKKLIV